MMRDVDRWAVEHEVIALDGCDGTGKTTLAAQLVTRHGYTSVHASLTPGDVDLVARHRAILAWPGRLVLDRSFLSELVYGPLFRQRSRLSRADADALADLVAGRDGTFIHLTGSAERIAARLSARDGHAPPVAQLDAILGAYRDVFACVAERALVITIDTTAGQSA